MSVNSGTAISRRLERGSVPKLYALADVEALGAARTVDAVKALADLGIGWIQIRAKSLDDRGLYDLTERAVRAVEGRQARLWINDRADLAMLFPVSGVHVGQDDLPPEAVRAAVGDRCWIGHSTHDLEQLRAADADPDVDVIALGPIFATTSKRNADPAVGLETLRQARRLTRKPLIAIGGIDAKRLPGVLRAGADSAAILGAICRGDIEPNVRRLQACLTESKA